ncbi:unnamed protein product [Durusdinium trenchii]|uniref:Uncharacterized protein n=1 Tax=Durusdinium trenchii TaxID=1381693 RepID=A0ABP0KUH4_9DINO
MRPSTAERRGGRHGSDLEMKTSTSASPEEWTDSPRDHGWKSRRLNTIASRAMMVLMGLFLIGILPGLRSQGTWSSKPYRKEIAGRNGREDSEDPISVDGVETPKESSTRPVNAEEDKDLFSVDGGPQGVKAHLLASTSREADKDLIHVDGGSEGAKERSPASSSGEVDKDLFSVDGGLVGAKERPTMSGSGEADKDLIHVDGGLDGGEEYVERLPPFTNGEADKDFFSVDGGLTGAKEHPTTTLASGEANKDLFTVEGGRPGAKERPTGRTERETEKDLISVDGGREGAKERPVTSMSREADKDFIRVDAGVEGAKDSFSAGGDLEGAKELPTRPPPAVVPPIPTAQPHAVEASVAESGDAASTTALVMVKQAVEGGAEIRFEAAPLNAEKASDVRVESGDVSSKDENLPSASFAAVQVPQKVSDVRMESEDVASTTAALVTTAKEAVERGAEVRVEAASSKDENPPSTSPAAAQVPQQASDVHVEAGDAASTTAALVTTAKEAVERGAEVRVEAVSSKDENPPSASFAAVQVPQQASDVHVESGDAAFTTALAVAAKKAVEAGAEVTVETAALDNHLSSSVAPLQEGTFLHKVETAMVNAEEGFLHVGHAAEIGARAIKQVAEGTAEAGEVIVTAAKEVAGEVIARAAETGESLSSEVVSIKQSLPAS